MDFKIIYTSQSDDDIITIKENYIVKSQINRFLSDLGKQLDYLKSNPFISQIYYKNIRIIHLKHFLYSIHFSINNDEVTIIGVLHQKQKRVF